MSVELDLPKLVIYKIVRMRLEYHFVEVGISFRQGWNIISLSPKSVYWKTIDLTFFMKDAYALMYKLNKYIISIEK